MKKKTVYPFFMNAGRQSHKWQLKIFVILFIKGLKTIGTKISMLVSKKKHFAEVAFFFAYFFNILAYKSPLISKQTHKLMCLETKPDTTLLAFTV